MSERVETEHLDWEDLHCEECSHYDELNSFCWLYWEEMSPVDTCPNHSSAREMPVEAEP